MFQQDDDQYISNYSEVGDMREEEQIMDHNYLSKARDLIDNSRTSENQYKDQHTKLVEFLTEYFQGQKFIGFVLNKEMDNNDREVVLTLTLLLEKYNSKFYAFSEYRFKLELNQIESFTYITNQDGTPLAIKEKSSRLLLGRYFTRLNSMFRFGAYSIHPFQGFIKLKMCTVYGFSNFQEILKLNKTSAFLIMSFIKQINVTSHFSNGFHIYKILYQANLLQEEAFDELKSRSNYQYRPLPNDLVAIETQLKDITDKCETLEMKPTKTNLEKFSQFFVVPRQTPIVGMDTKICSDINVQTPYDDFLRQIRDKDNHLNSGGFADIYKTKITYVFQQGDQKKQETRFFVAKVEKRSNEKRNNIEKDILKTLVSEGFSGECPYIAKFYIPIQEQYKNVIFMEYYHHNSLDNFKVKFHQTMSLNSKIFILFQIAIGLKYLNDCKVSHLDLKPGNILISKNYISKITDFGESIIIKDTKSGNEENPGYTMPYCSPDLFSKTFNERTDVFSFGMLAYDFVFETFPVDFKKNELSILVSRYKIPNIVIRSNEEYVKLQGPKRIMKILRVLFLKCLSANPTERPYLEWIIVVLRLSLQYLDKLY